MSSRANRLGAMMLGLLAAIALLAASAGFAQASEALCDVYEIKASNDPGGIDKDLQKLEKTLRKPPFTSWTAFKLLKRHSQLAAVRKPVQLALSTGGTMKLLIRDRLDRQGKAPRLRITATMFNAKGKQTTEVTSVVDSGNAWLIGGAPLEGHPGATYFVGVDCAVK
jgi:hypothetical protein